MNLTVKEAENIFDTYHLFNRNKRLRYKVYTKIYPDYINIKFYIFKYHNNIGFHKFIFTKNYIYFIYICL